ncbi:amino acid permease [Vibrio cholerae]
MVAGNMMGSGIALLPSTLASVGSISIYSWLICIVGALSLAFVFARLATKNPQEGGPIAYAGEVSLECLVSKRACFTTTLTGLVIWRLRLLGVSYLSVFFPVLNNPIPAGLATIASVWLFTLVNLLGGSWVSRLCTIGLVLILIPVVGTALFGWTHFDSALYSQNWNVSA